MARTEWRVYRVTSKISTDRCLDREIAERSAEDARAYCVARGADVRVVTDLGPLDDYMARLVAANTEDRAAA